MNYVVNTASLDTAEGGKKSVENVPLCLPLFKKQSLCSFHLVIFSMEHIVPTAPSLSLSLSLCKGTMCTTPSRVTVKSPHSASQTHTIWTQCAVCCVMSKQSLPTAVWKALDKAGQMCFLPSADAWIVRPNSIQQSITVKSCSAVKVLYFGGNSCYWSYEERTGVITMK